MATKAPNRFTVTFDTDSMFLFKRIEEITGLSPAQTLQKLFPAHLEELWAYVDWFESLSEEQRELRSRGKNFLASYGPGSLIDDIKRIDPKYRTPAERMQDEINANPMTLDELMQGDSKGAK